LNKFMHYALKLAAKGRGRTSPNPMVGAVVVKNGSIVGEGYHQKAGCDHAESNALNQAGEQAKGAIMYVTLEPCVHYGKTPPCTDRIVKAGISKVVIAMLDPNPIVCNKGVKTLRDKGIEIELGEGEYEARRLNEIFIKNMQQQRPFVIMKSALSLDGKIATGKYDSKWISSESSRLKVQHLRNSVDSILVGKHTFLCDNPRLNIRLAEAKEIWKIILTQNCDLDAKILEQSAAYQNSIHKKIIVIGIDNQQARTNMKALRDIGCKVILSKQKNGFIDLDHLLSQLLKMEICSVMVEGGSVTNTQFFCQNCVDKVYLFQAPILIGNDGIPFVQELNTESVKEAIRLQNIEQENCGDDVLTIGYLRKE